MDDAYFLIALFAGIVPACFWLWFWLREDSEQPEPWALVIISFLSGMLVVLLVLPLQQMAQDLYRGDTQMFVFVVIEEAMKYLIALLVVLWNRAVDEPIDLVMYMIFVALGFAALENALFIYNPLGQGQYLESMFTGGLRFVGATLLHVLASASVGVCMALAFYRSNVVRLVYGTVGLCIAIVLHALFNFSIMSTTAEGILFVFMFVWLGVIALFVAFEKVKQLRRPGITTSSRV